MKQELSVREKAAERARGAKWFRSLDREAQGTVGDGFVLGDFDWTDWFESKPSGAFLNGAGKEMLYVESED